MDLFVIFVAEWNKSQIVTQGVLLYTEFDIGIIVVYINMI